MQDWHDSEQYCYLQPMENDDQYRFDSDLRAPADLDLSELSNEEESKDRVSKSPIRRTNTMYSHVRKYSLYSNVSQSETSPDSPRRFYLQNKVNNVSSFKNYPYLKQSSIRSTNSGNSSGQSPGVSVQSQNRNKALRLVESPHAAQIQSESQMTDDDKAKMINLFNKQSFFHHGSRLSTITQKKKEENLVKVPKTLASSFSRNSNVKCSSSNSMRQRPQYKSQKTSEVPSEDEKDQFSPTKRDIISEKITHSTLGKLTSLVQNKNTTSTSSYPSTGANSPRFAQSSIYQSFLQEEQKLQFVAGNVLPVDGSPRGVASFSFDNTPRNKNSDKLVSFTTQLELVPEEKNYKGIDQKIEKKIIGQSSRPSSGKVRINQDPENISLSPQKQRAPILQSGNLINLKIKNMAMEGGPQNLTPVIKKNHILKQNQIKAMGGGIMFPRTMYQTSTQNKRNAATLRRTAFSVTKKTQQQLTSLSAAAQFPEESRQELNTRSEQKSPNIPSITKAPTPCLRTQMAPSSSPMGSPLKKRQQRARGGSFTVGQSTTLAGNVILPLRFRNEVLNAFNLQQGFNPFPLQPKVHPGLRTSNTFSKGNEERDNLREMILSLGQK